MLDADASRERAVRAGWDQVRVLSRLEHGPSNRLLADVLDDERARAAAALDPPPERWRGVSELRYATYGSGPVQARIRRVMDFIAPRDRVLDVGIGIGYPSCVLMRDSGLSYYCGVDVSQRYVDVARHGIAVNGLSGVDHELDCVDIHDVDRAFTSRHRPDIILVLEVLEHLADPDAAVAALAAAMDSHTRLLFTVPMLGRLEGLWGHLSLFDEARIRELCERAGLTIDHVEPVYNTWILVLASRGANPPGEDGPVPPDPLAGRYSFLPVAVPDPSLRVRAGRRDGVAIPLADPEVFRMEITYEDPENLETVSVEALASGEPRMAWTWSLTPRNRPESRPITCVFRNGRPTRHFKSTLAAGSEGVDEVRVRLTAGAGPTAATIHRVASVGRRAERDHTSLTSP